MDNTLFKKLICVNAASPVYFTHHSFKSDDGEKNNRFVYSTNFTFKNRIFVSRACEINAIIVSQKSPLVGGISGAITIKPSLEMFQPSDLVHIHARKLSSSHRVLAE